MPKSSLLWSPMKVKTYIRHERFVVLKVLELYVAVHLRGVERRMINGRAESKDGNGALFFKRDFAQALAILHASGGHRLLLDDAFFLNTR